MTGVQVPDAVEVTPDGLKVRWLNADSIISAGALRAACRCAECRAASIRAGNSADHPNVQLTGAQPVGHYALQLEFSDGHDRGIFPWELIHDLCKTGDRRLTRRALLSK